MSKLKVAVVGSGLIARVKHLPALKGLGNLVDRIAICDLNEQAAREIGAKFEVAATFSDLDRMLAEEKPDVVDICTPPKTHAAIAKAALNAGAHVLIEKPMCQTVEECDEVMALAREKGLKICIAHSDLFYPSFRKAREMLKAGKIGEFRGMRMHLSTPVDYITAKEDHWANKLPGGVFGESGPHVVYMTLAYINPITDVHVVGRKLMPEYPWSPYEDYRVTMAGENGTCTASLIYTTNHWACNVEIWGSDGTLRADLEAQTLTHIRREKLTAVEVGTSAISEAAQILLSGFESGLDKISRRYTQTHQELLKAFLQAIVDGTEAPVPPEEGRESIRVMNLITDQLAAK